MMVVSGVGLYETNEVLSHQELKQFILETPYDNNIIVESDDRIEIVSKSTECDYLLTRITKDETTIKCGYWITAQFDTVVEYYRTYGIDMWVRNNRKKTQIKLSVEEVSGALVVSKSTPFYKGRSGSDGLLLETYTLGPDEIIMSWKYAILSLQKHRIALRFSKDKDDSYYSMGPDGNKVSNTVLYGDEKGTIEIDSVMVIGNEPQVRSRDDHLEVLRTTNNDIIDKEQEGFYCNSWDNEHIYCDERHTIDNERGDSNGDGICTSGETCEVMDYS